MSSSMTFEQKRDAKVRRALVRLKYSLMADRELYEMDEAVRAALTNGEVLRLETTLEDILNDETR